LPEATPLPPAIVAARDTPFRGTIRCRGRRHGRGARHPPRPRVDPGAQGGPDDVGVPAVAARRPRPDRQRRPAGRPGHRGGRRRDGHPAFAHVAHTARNDGADTVARLGRRPALCAFAARSGLAGAPG
jgi:hypothetical protein